MTDNDLVRRLLDRADVAEANSRFDDAEDMRNAASVIVGTLSACAKLKAAIKALDPNHKFAN